MSEAPLSLAGLTEAPVTPDQSAPDVRHPPLVLAAMAALAGAVLVVAILGHTIASGSRFAFDSTIMLALRQDGNLAVPAGPFWLKQAMIDVTALGGETVLTLAVAVTVGFLIASRHLLAAALVFAGTVTGSIAVASVKIWVGRGSASFPSGHAANSAIIYLTIVLLSIQIITRRTARWFLFGVTVLLVAAIGMSRVYLGVHWPSDVLAGWSFGTLWALAWWAFGSWLRLRLTRDTHA